MRIAHCGEFGANMNETVINALLYSTREPVSCFTERGYRERKKRYRELSS